MISGAGVVDSCKAVSGSRRALSVNIDHVVFSVDSPNLHKTARQPENADGASAPAY